MDLVLDVVDDVLGLLCDVVDELLGLADVAVSLTFSLQVVVVGEITDNTCDQPCVAAT